VDGLDRHRNARARHPCAVPRRTALSPGLDASPRAGRRHPRASRQGRAGR
jgi:hypothetical protein